jgi:ATP-dependent RNA helicase RhlE
MKEKIKFEDMDLMDPIQRAIAAEGYEEPTPIQVEAIPHLLEGRDLLGCAQTGTGKTAAFALPILQHLALTNDHRFKIRALILTPTRELAAQIDESFRVYGRFMSIKTTVIFGGVSQYRQEKALRLRPQVLVATPGRLLDLMGQGIVRLGSLEVFVLDEADRMLDMGFIHDVRRVIAELPSKRQTLFFSATMPPAVEKLASTLLTDPVKVEVAPQATPADRIKQVVMYVDKGDKKRLLEDLLDRDEITKALIFTRTKHMANRLAQLLSRRKVLAFAIHGNKSQSARTRALDGFRAGEVRVLIATDIASRGIDVEGISHVINFELPNESETYVHRIGRTARAGAKGVAISFCSGEEKAYLNSIEKLLKQKVIIDNDHKYHSDDASKGLVDGALATTAVNEKKKGGGNRGGRRRKGGGQSKKKPRR